MAEEKNCPKCGSHMNFRLGQYECPQCGHYEVKVKEAQQPGKPEPSGPGFKQPYQGGPTRSGARVPPPPAPGTLYQPGQSISDAGSYGGAYGSPAPEPANDGLTIEKHIYFGIQTLSYLIVIIGMLALSPSEMGLGPELDSMVGSAVIGGIIGSIIGLALLAFVLYGTQIWAKWCCGGCTVVGLLGAVPALLAAPGAGFGGGP